MNGWYTKLSFVENSKLGTLTNTIIIWLQQARNNIDESKVQDSLTDVFPVIDDAITLQNAISNAQEQVMMQQGGQLTPTQSSLIGLITQRVQDPMAQSNVNRMPTVPIQQKIVKPLENLKNMIEENRESAMQPLDETIAE